MIGFSAVSVPGLTAAGTRALTIILCTVVAWAVGPAHPASVTLLMFAIVMIAGVASPETVFRLWTTPVVWTMVGSFLMARAATSSGLADRMARTFLSRVGAGYKRLIIASYVLGAALSIIIPQPFPRTVLIWTIYRTLLQRFTNDPVVTRIMCFAVFSSAVPTSMGLLTADTVLNVAAASFAEPPISWTEWARLMFVPSMMASALMCAAFLAVFGPILKQRMPEGVDGKSLPDEKTVHGAMTAAEKKVLAWCLGAAVMWATTNWHGINPAWVALVCAGGLSLPWVGEVLTVEDIGRGVNWATLVFVTGASAIGNIANSSGISEMLAARFAGLNVHLSDAGFMTAATLLTMGIHMLVGSALSAVAIVVPLLSAWGLRLGINPSVACLVAYVVSTMQWALPFQHVTILIGQNEPGGYGAGETLRFAIPLVILTLASVLLVFLPWWAAIGALRAT